jgi:hypothetical protein
MKSKMAVLLIILTCGVGIHAKSVSNQHYGTSGGGPLNKVIEIQSEGTTGGGPTGAREIDFFENDYRDLLNFFKFLYFYDR